MKRQTALPRLDQVYKDEIVRRAINRSSTKDPTEIKKLILEEKDALLKKEFTLYSPTALITEEGFGLVIYFGLLCLAIWGMLENLNGMVLALALFLLLLLMFIIMIKIMNWAYRQGAEGDWDTYREEYSQAIALMDSDIAKNNKK